MADVETTVRNATGLLELIENMLGWDPHAIAAEKGQPVWKVRSVEAGKINRKVATKPELYTWPHLVTAVGYCVRNKVEIQAPLGIFFHVERALAEAREDIHDSRLIDGHIASAVAWEQAHELPGFAEWIVTLSRASGDMRKGVYEQWQQERLQPNTP